MDDVFELAVVFVVLLEVYDLADVGLEQVEEGSGVVLLLLWENEEA